MASGPAVERLRDFLGNLSPGSRSLLIAEIEAGIARGDAMPGAMFILAEIRGSMAEGEPPSRRMNNLARLFFHALDPFLIDEAGTNSRGRIARGSLMPVWRWVTRDLMPQETAAASQEVDGAIAAGDAERAEQFARAFQNAAIALMEAALRAARADDAMHRKLTVRIGTARPIEDAQAVVTVLKARDVLETLGTQLPARFGNFGDQHLDRVKSLLDAPLAADPDVFLYSLVLVMDRLQTRWQLIRLGKKAAGSDAATLIQQSPYGASVDIVLSEMGRMVAELRDDLGSGRNAAIAGLLKDVHDTARGLRTELNLSGDSSWARQLAALRGEVSNVVKTEIESVPERVRTLLRHRPVKEIAADSVLDASEVDEIEKLIEFVGACRHYAGELALSEATQRVHTELQHYLEAATRALVDGLRTVSETERSFRRSQVDAAVRFCAKIFGKEYAALLTKAASVAADSERRRVSA